jgi:predicted RNase H-like HicB family nuclease
MGERGVCLLAETCLAEEREVRIETEIEDDGRWVAEVPDLPGVLTYGGTREEAISRVEALALRVIADRLDHGEVIPDLDALFARTA